MEALVLQFIGSIILPSVIAAGGAIGWFSKVSAKHLDDKFAGLSTQITVNDSKIERVERDLLEMQARLPREFVMREEFVAHTRDSSKKIDYIVEQIDSIKGILMARRRTD